jgi:hypothetical protein
MKTKFITLFFMLFLFAFSAQSQEKQSIIVQQKQVSENTIYQLYPTQNYYTFIKLDTRNGKMWQVHFAISKEGFEGEIILNSNSLLWSDEVEVNGRFTLYPTNNIYNFILLDQLKGKTYQVQWNNEQEKRFVSPIY